MSRHILMKDSQSQRYTLSPLDPREQALSFASIMVDDGSLQIVKNKNGQGELISMGCSCEDAADCGRLTCPATDAVEVMDAAIKGDRGER